MTPAAELAAAAPAAPTEPRPWRRGLAWLLFLGPFFFLSYGFANNFAASYGEAGVIVFDWERQIPFVPWTIVPYWSIDLFYGLAFLLCRDRRETDILGLRLLSAQLIAITCFLFVPLRFSFARPATDGLAGALFAALSGFDLPYNQAPSLHIALLVILWLRYAASAGPRLRWVVHAWSLLIAVSVLTTWQHHFIDLPTGALAGLVCLWLWPDRPPSPWTAWTWTDDPQRRRLAVRYGLGAIACALAAGAGGWALWLVWPALSLALVALAYAGLGPAAWQKHGGRLSLASTWLFAPYLAAAWINSRLWTRRDPQAVAIADAVGLGRLPRAADMGHYTALVDLSAELPAPRGDWRYAGLPWLDLVAPTTADLARAAAAIEGLRRDGPVLVCCALGYSRSACAVAAWLLVSGRADSVDAALALIGERRPRVVLGAPHRAALAPLARRPPSPLASA